MATQNWKKTASLMLGFFLEKHVQDVGNSYKMDLQLNVITAMTSSTAQALSTAPRLTSATCDTAVPTTTVLVSTYAVNDFNYDAN